jgi:hypothetical protein
MNMDIKEIIWLQFGAAIDMLENAIHACPIDIWGDSSAEGQFWYISYHTLFFLDFYSTASPDDFAPPQPFTLAELDPAGLFPERVYNKTELLKYLDHCRNKCREAIIDFTGEKSHQFYVFESLKLNFTELLLYNMRHVQHHTAQLNMILRLNINSAPKWVRQTDKKLI